MHTVFVSCETEKRMGEALFQQIRCLPMHDTTAMPRQSARRARLCMTLRPCHANPHAAPLRSEAAWLRRQRRMPEERATCCQARTLRHGL